MLTDKEKKVLEHLVNASNEFSELTVLHRSDQWEFNLHIHALQNIVMARVAVRQHPELFRIDKISFGNENDVSKNAV